MFFYVAYHIPTRTTHYRKREAVNSLAFLRTLDGWNARACGMWQFHRVTPGFACPKDEDKYECTD